MKKIILILLVLNSGLLAISIEKFIEEDIIACKAGNIETCLSVGKALSTGENAKNQDKKTLGMEFIRKACKYGKTEACDILGDSYYLEKNYQASRPYLIKSCNRGVKTACEAVGTIYRDGHETKQDDVQARIYYEKACELKSPDACINVAFMYRGGFGVTKSRTKEKSFYKKACDLENKAGCTLFTKMDNKDKGIEEPSLWSKFKNLF